jgi:hypothetical protein
MTSFLHTLHGRISIAFGNIRCGACPARYLALAIAALSGGCSIHPVQQEVTGIKTDDLVQFIRCETRLAIQDKAIDLLKDEYATARDLYVQTHGVEPPFGPSPLISVLTSYRGGYWPPARIIKAGMNAHERAIYDKYIETGIAFDFSFDITEGNSGSGVADPIRLITNGTYGIGLSASGNYMRQNLRHFVVSDTAQSLLENVKLKCLSDYRGTSYTYPMSGRIGMKELISTFFDLNEVKELSSADKDKPTTVFVDTLTFTTTLMGSVTPHVIVSPVGNAWGLAEPGASIIAGASRLDKHSLIVGLSLDKPKGVAVAAGIVPGTGARSALQKVNVRPGSTEQSALDAVHQGRVDAYLDRANR